MPDPIFQGRLRLVPGQNPGVSTGLGTNTYLLGGERLILIDTGAGVPTYAPRLKQAMAELGGSLSLVLITHGHSDHIGGVEAIQRMAPGALVAKFPDPERPSGFRAIADGERIQHDGVTLEALHTPGHAADHLCFFWVEERALFSGDLILGEGTAVIPRRGGSLPDYLESLTRLQSLDIRRIYPGHGPPIQNPQARIAEYIEHRRMRERQILEALRDGAGTIPDMVARIYAGVPGELHRLAEESVWNHLVKLEQEGRVRRVHPGGEDGYALGARWTFA
jgi:glyoxylase-like metal-dependent hydrolase (beta-lactamase superfamily II)